MCCGVRGLMRGRRVLMESFVSHGVRHIFGNPGTTETPLLDSLPAFPQIEYVMALHAVMHVRAFESEREFVGDGFSFTLRTGREQLLHANSMIQMSRARE